MKVVMVLSGLVGTIQVFIGCVVCCKYYRDFEEREEGALLKLTISILWLPLLILPYIVGELDVLKEVQEIIPENNILIFMQMYICTMYVVVPIRIKYIGKYKVQYNKHMYVLEDGKWIDKDVPYKITRWDGYVCLTIYVILLFAADVILVYMLYSSYLEQSVIGSGLIAVLEKLKELGYMSYIIYAIVLIASVGFHVLMLSQGVVAGGKALGHIEMFILEKKLASRYGDVDLEGEYFRGEKIRGFYCFSWTNASVMDADNRERVVRGIELQEEVGGKDPSFWLFLNEIKYTYVFETQSGWYFTTDSGIRPWKCGSVPWMEVREYAGSTVIDLIILSKEEINFLSDSSYFARIYNQKYRRNRMPIIIENKAVPKS